MASTTKQMNITAGNAQATVNATVNDSMPGIPCLDPAGYRYVGARYVPLFADPLQWSSANTYEPLTIVVNEGNSYTSRTYVPVGIDISNTDYWALTGNYNAQIEQYRQEVQEAVQELNGASAAGFLYGKKAVVYGDSTWALFGATSIPSLLEDLTGMDIENRAISGTSLSPNTYNQSTDATDLWHLMQNATAADFVGFDYCICAYSTNDWQQSKRLFDNGTGSQSRVSFIRSMREAIDKLNSFNPTMRVVFVAPAYAYKATWESSSPNINNLGLRLTDYAEAMKRVCHEKNCGFIDLSCLGANDSNYTYLFENDSDGVYVHYNEALRNKVATAVYGAYPWNTPDVDNAPSYRQDISFQAQYNSSNANIEPTLENYLPYDSNCSVRNMSFLNSTNTYKLTSVEEFNLSEQKFVTLYAIKSGGKLKVYAEQNPDDYIVVNFDYERLSIPIPIYDGYSKIVFESLTTSNLTTIAAMSLTDSPFSYYPDSNSVTLSGENDNLSHTTIITSVNGIHYLVSNITTKKALNANEWVVVGTIPIDFLSYYQSALIGVTINAPAVVQVIGLVQYGNNNLLMMPLNTVAEEINITINGVFSNVGAR